MSLGLSGTGTCTLVTDDEGFVKGAVAEAMSDSEAGQEFSTEDVVYYNVAGCEEERRARRERRRALTDGGVVVVILVFRLPYI